MQRASGKVRRRSAWILPILALLIFGGAARIDDTLLAIGRSLELFGAVFREVAVNYADPVDPMNLMRAGIRGMLAALDPYTTFIEKEERVDVDMLTQGSYGGLGISVASRSGRHTVAGMLDPTATELSGVRIGDEIVAVDTQRVEGTDVDLKTLLRGKAGTSVTLTLRRPPATATFTRNVMRRDVAVRSLTLAARLGDGTGYLRLERFTRGAGDEVRRELQSFASDTSIHGLVLDLRDNPGGLLESAVAVCELFLPRGSMIVSTRGRQEQFGRVYVSTHDPISTTLPLVVLINGASASASEIVAGALQDHDRALIVGTTSFGKGLVQTITSLTPDASLKMTTSRYYTPSGRCIQKVIRYGKSKDVVNPVIDTSRWFRTIRLHRTVFAAGGITPDLSIATDSIPPYVTALLRNSALFDFVTRTLNVMPAGSVPAVDDAVKRKFHAHLDSTHFVGDTILQNAWKQLADGARNRGMGARSLARIDAIARDFRAAQAQEYDAAWPQIRRELLKEYAFRSGGRAARLRATIDSDAQVNAARALLAAHWNLDALLSHPQDAVRVH